MIVHKINILKALGEAGFTTYVLLNDSDPRKRLGSSQVQSLRQGMPPGAKALDTICRMLGKQPGDIIEYMPDDQYDALRESGYFEKKGIVAPPRKDKGASK